VQEELETGRKPFDGIGLALATHFHLDHWDAGAISRFLRSNPQALFASTEQATAMIPSALRGRVLNLWPTNGQPSTLVAGAAKVTAIPLKHGATQNLAYRLELSGKTVAHLGDADPSVENFEKLASAGPVDLALVPFWWLLDSEATSFMKRTGSRGPWPPCTSVRPTSTPCRPCRRPGPGCGRPRNRGSPARSSGVGQARGSGAVAAHLPL
jgi:hypothetical protein